MQATIKFPAAGNESWWKRDEEGKAFHKITVTGADGKDYKVRVTEGTPEWTMPAGAQIAIELRTNRNSGEQYAVLEGTPQNQSRAGGGGYSRREWQTPTPAKAKEAADFTADLYKAVKGRLPELGNEAVSMLVGKIIEKLC